MATKFGYVERNLENDVNWAQVGKGFSDMLLAERDEREAKKGNLDDLMAKTQEGLRNTPLGYNTTFNDQMVGLGANSSAFVLAANKDLKAGRITPEDYMRKLHRVNSSADTTFALANSYNEIYEDKLKRMDDKTSGNVEQAAFEAMSNLVDFNKHDFMIDQDGTIVAAPLITDENGITTLDTKNAKSVQAIFNLAQNKVDRFDVQGSIETQVARLGKDILGTDVAATYGKAGMKKVIQDMSKNSPDKYKNFKEGVLKEMLVNDLDVASILTDYSPDYETTTDKKKWLANKDKYVYVDIDNGKEILIGELTEKQKEDAMNILDNAWEGQVDTSSVETATAKKERSPFELEKIKQMNGKTESKKILATYWNQLGWGTAAQKQSAIESLMSNSYVREGGMLGIEPNEDGTVLNFIYDGGRTSRPIDLTKNYTAKEWASIGAEIHGEDNAETALAAGGGWKKDVTFTTATAGDSKFKVKGVIRQGVTTDRATQEDNVTTVDNFSQAITNTIVKNKGQQIADAINAAGGNAKYNNGKVTIGETDKLAGKPYDITTDSGVKFVKKWIRGFVGNNYDQMKIFSSGGKKYVGLDANGDPIYEQQ